MASKDRQDSGRDGLNYRLSKYALKRAGPRARLFHFQANAQRTIFILISLRGNTKSSLNSGENTIFHLGFLNLSGYV
jgi:hypothetical protein